MIKVVITGAAGEGKTRLVEAAFKSRAMRKENIAVFDGSKTAQEALDYIITSRDYAVVFVTNDLGEAEKFLKG